MKTIAVPLRLIIVLGLMVAFNSCSNKDDDSPAPEPSTAELLVKKWFFLKTEDANGTVLEQADACTGKTFFDFNNDGTFYFQEFGYDNDQVCDNSPLENGEYTLSADETELTLFGSFGGDVFPIRSISETELVLVFGTDEIISFKN